jgi:hypothetical protein
LDALGDKLVLRWAAKLKENLINFPDTSEKMSFFALGWLVMVRLQISSQVLYHLEDAKRVDVKAPVKPLNVVMQ